MTETITPKQDRKEGNTFISPDEVQAIHARFPDYEDYLTAVKDNPCYGPVVAAVGRALWSGAEIKLYPVGLSGTAGYGMDLVTSGHILASRLREIYGPYPKETVVPSALKHKTDESDLPQERPTLDQQNSQNAKLSIFARMRNLIS
jgi:hypothetical protein